LNFKEYLLLFANEPNQIGEMVRAIFYGQSRHIIINQQQEIQKIIDDESTSNNHNKNKLHEKITKYMTDEKNQANLLPDTAFRMNHLFEILKTAYQSYQTIEPNLNVMNDDIFGIQFSPLEIPLKERDYEAVKVIAPPMKFKCVNCEDDDGTRPFKQVFLIDFPNDKIKINTWFECENCNMLKLVS